MQRARKRNLGYNEREDRKRNRGACEESGDERRNLGYNEREERKRNRGACEEAGDEQRKQTREFRKRN